MDLGFERAGIQIRWQCEKDPFGRAILAAHWPLVEVYDDAWDLCWTETDPVDVIFGGDPCQCRSRGGNIRKRTQPDLSGLFLAIVHARRPRWVVRENVCAEDLGDFVRGLRLGGYAVCSLELDARDFTAQSRRRSFTIGSDSMRIGRFVASLDDARGNPVLASVAGATSPSSYCVCAHPNRPAEADVVYEPMLGLRLLSVREIERLQGFPVGWFRGLSRTRTWILCGQAVCVPVAEWIANRVVATDQPGPTLSLKGNADDEKPDS